MSLRSQRSRVTFCEEIEMDSLEPEMHNLLGKNLVLGTIKEYEFNGQSIEDEFYDENLNEFLEFDVSSSFMNALAVLIKLNGASVSLSLCSESSEKLSREVQL